MQFLRVPKRHNLSSEVSNIQFLQIFGFNWDSIAFDCGNQKKICVSDSRSADDYVKSAHLPSSSVHRPDNECNQISIEPIEYYLDFSRSIEIWLHSTIELQSFSCVWLCSIGSIDDSVRLRLSGNNAFKSWLKILMYSSVGVIFHNDMHFQQNWALVPVPKSVCSCH